MDDETTDGPLTNGANGRDPATGHFLPGNTAAAGHGNPNAKRVHELRSALLDAISPEDLGVIVRQLVEKAKAGDVVAAREVLDRCLGKATQPIEGPTRYMELVLTPEERECARKIAERCDAID